MTWRARRCGVRARARCARASTAGWGHDGVPLTVQPEVCQVSGYVEDFPVIESRSMDVNCIVRAGEWVVLAGLDDWRLAKERRGIGRLYAMDTEGTGSVVLLPRADRVGYAGAEVRPIEVEDDDGSGIQQRGNGDDVVGVPGMEGGRLGSDSAGAALHWNGKGAAMVPGGGHRGNVGSERHRW